MPWRQTSDPYAIWVSEAMLQQTQVATALPYYDRWMSRFPTALSLAKASDDDALALWQGLGYYRRCRMLLVGVRLAVENGWPTSCEEWKHMPGVGVYTAAALASICLGEAVPVVDGNVERAFCRVMASEAVGAQRTALARKWASKLIDGNRPADWNQAIMELGATVCTPRNPKCDECPIAHACAAFRADAVANYPVKPAKPNIVPIEQTYVVPLCEDHVGLLRAQPGEWWAGLYRFPRPQEAPSGSDEPRGAFRHAVTKHRLTCTITRRTCHEKAPELEWFPIADFDRIPIPSAMRKAWKL